MHIYAYIYKFACAYICLRTLMRIHDTAQHAVAQLLRFTIYAHTHVYIHAYVYTCIYIHIYMFVHTYTYNNIYTHIQHVHIQARKHAWNDGVEAKPDLTPGSFALLPVCCNSEGVHPS